MIRKTIAIISLLLLPAISSAQSRLPQEAPKSTRKTEVVPLAYAWTVSSPFGRQITAEVDTMFENYSLEFVPATVTPAWVTTGNYGCQGKTLIYTDTQPASDFFFSDALAHWLPSQRTWKFYNSRVPMTLVGYNFGGGKETSQDRLSVDFSGNINQKAQVGAMLDYLYSKGSYNYQAMKDLTWGFDGSYIGDRYQFQGFFYHYNLLNKENGGITNELYITDPAEIQGGSTKVDYKTIPTYLNASHNRTVGAHLFLNNRYSLGMTKEIELAEDSIVERFIPVTTFGWTLEYKSGRHTFVNTNVTQDEEYWQNRYLSLDGTRDKTSYWSVKNVFTASLLEGFNKYAKAGLSVYLAHEYRKYTMPVDTLHLLDVVPEALTPITFANREATHGQNLVWVGGELARRQGRILNYEAIGEIGLIGDAAGELALRGNVNTNIPMFGDTLNVVGFGDFSNRSVPYLLQHFVSNHFAWDNDFGKTRRLRFGGRVDFAKTCSSIEIAAENVQNLVYFNESALPTQHSGSVQVFSATLRQDFHFGAWHWQNRVTYQTSSNQAVIPMPKLAVNSNMFVKFKIAGVFHVQFGVDCDYYTKYRALGYQPATATFYNANDSEVGNYPYMNAYVNMKLSKTRFYVMFAHVNQGWFGNNDYFSMRNYPLNPRRLQMGLSIDFAN